MVSNQDQMSTQIELKSTHKWTIPNWIHVQQDENLVRIQTLDFELGNSSFYSTWKVGLDMIHSSGNPMIQPFLKLEDLKGDYDKLDIVFDAKILGDPNLNKVEKILSVGDVIFRQTNMWLFNHPSTNTLTHFFTDGGITILISLTIRTIVSPTDICDQKSSNLLSENMAKLLKNHSDADLKIITSDQVELVAHKHILKTQNDVFSKMLASEFSENSTGIIQVDDVTGKTMKILLHYLYTGKLLPEWKDDDIIVEWTYAAEKYQLTFVLEMLDNTLGQRNNSSVCKIDFQLLNLTSKIPLRNAESILLKRIIQRINNIDSAADLFLIIDYPEVVEVPKGEEQFVEVFKVFNNIIGDQDSNEFSASDLRILSLAKKYSMKNVENKLLQQLKNTVKNLKSSDDLFKLFSIGVVTATQSVNENGLVRSNPNM